MRRALGVYSIPPSCVLRLSAVDDMLFLQENVFRNTPHHLPVWDEMLISLPSHFFYLHLQCRLAATEMLIITIKQLLSTKTITP